MRCAHFDAESVAQWNNGMLTAEADGHVWAVSMRAFSFETLDALLRKGQLAGGLPLLGPGRILR